jgi:hypothetical protein
VPEISRFLGIVIAMYYRDHRPAHFHASYGDNHAAIILETGELLAGYLTARAAALVEEWRRRYKLELQRNWALCEGSRPLEPIRPLD